MVARNDEMSMPLYVGTFKKCCNYINKNSYGVVDEKSVFKKFKDQKEVEVDNAFIIVKTEVEKQIKTKEEVLLQEKEIKYALKNYHKIKEYIRLDKLELQEWQDRMEGQFGGSIIPCDKNGDEVTKDRTHLMLHLIEKKQEVLDRISENVYYIQIAQDFIRWLEDENKKMVIDKYINRLSGIEMEGKYNYSIMHIYRKIYEKIECFVNEM